MQNIMDSMFYPNCPFEIDSYKIYYKNQADKLACTTVDNDISRIMVGSSITDRSNVLS